MGQNNYTEVELLQGLIEGDKGVVRYIYKVYKPILTKWLVAHGGLDTDAEDIFQEALIVMYEKAQNPEFCLTCQIGTYLFAISKRLWLKKIQKAGRIQSFEFDEDIEQSENDPYTTSGLGTYDGDVAVYIEKEMQFDKLTQAMEKLGEPCSKLIQAFYIQDKSMQDIAQTFGYTNAENAKTQKYKCLTRLKKIYFELEQKLKTK